MIKNQMKVIARISLGMICLLVFNVGIVRGMTLENQQVANKINEQDFMSEPITRGEFIVDLMKLFEEEIGPYGEGSYVFVDVERNTSYGYYVQAAFYVGFINGMGEDNSYFKPNDPLTRQQAAVIVGEFIHSLNIEGEKKSVIFKDESAIAPWAKENVKIVSEAGVMIGDGAGLFNPKEVVTPEVADTLLIRLKDTYDALKK